MNNFIAIGNNEPTPDNLPDEIKKIINDGKKNAGFNPDGTPMSNPTDTNQASEDVLIELATKFDMDEYGTVNENGGYLIGEVRKLIRTEKLKLLAEVKERVVGEDEPGVTNIMIAAEHVRQNKALNKLEAEL